MYRGWGWVSTGCVTATRKFERTEPTQHWWRPSENLSLQGRNPEKGRRHNTRRLRHYVSPPLVAPGDQIGNLSVEQPGRTSTCCEAWWSDLDPQKLCKHERQELAPQLSDSHTRVCRPWKAGSAPTTQTLQARQSSLVTRTWMTNDWSAVILLERHLCKVREAQSQNFVQVQKGEDSTQRSVARVTLHCF